MSYFEHFDHWYYNFPFLIQEFNVLDTQPAGSLPLKVPLESDTTFWLIATTLFLSILLLLSFALCVNQRMTYQRKLKAATATAYGASCKAHDFKMIDFKLIPARDDSVVDVCGFGALSGRVPNTNKHSMEGSNPIWLKAYENEWFKNTEDFR